MKFDRHLLLRASVLSVLVGGVWTVGCGAQSPEVPEDDDGGDGGTSGTGFGGAGPTGGTLPNGGTSGTPPQGGSAGTFPQGGSAGTFPQGGSAGTGLSTGGSGGSGTAMCGTAVAAAGDIAIDNLEDGDNTISMPRVGYWYTYNDATGCTQTPAPDPSGLTPFVPAPGMGNAASVGARTNGMGCSLWGAGMGVDLNNCNMKSNAYDATVFNGIAFWYKSTTAVRMMVGTTANLPATAGGGCTDADQGMCYNHHGVDLLAAPSGMTMMVAFTGLSQAYGTMRPFMKNQILNIQFQAASAATATGFDITVDDLAFTP